MRGRTSTDVALVASMRVRAGAQRSAVTSKQTSALVQSCTRPANIFAYSASIACLNFPLAHTVKLLGSIVVTMRLSASIDS
jgi:hypothetical protein